MKAFRALVRVSMTALLKAIAPGKAGAALSLGLLSGVALLISVLIIAGLVKLFTKNTAAAALVAVAGCGTLIAGWIFASDKFAGLFGQIMESLSVFERFYTFIDGVFDLTAVVYYLSVIAVALFLTVQTMEKRRWS